MHFLTVACQIINKERTSPFGNYYDNNYLREETPMNAKTRGVNGLKTGVYTALLHLPTSDLGLLSITK